MIVNSNDDDRDDASEGDCDLFTKFQLNVNESQHILAISFMPKLTLPRTPPPTIEFAKST